MSIHEAHAIWKGNLKQGQGKITLGTEGVEIPYDFRSRFEDGQSSNPEELIGGAHAGCFSMALAHALGAEGFQPVYIDTTAQVHLEKKGDGFSISKIELTTEAEVLGIEDGQFQQCAQSAKENCPVSKALAAAEITLHASLLSAQHA